MIHELSKIYPCPVCDNMIYDGDTVLYYRHIHFCSIPCWRDYCMVHEVDFVEIKWIRNDKQ